MHYRDRPIITAPERSGFPTKSIPAINSIANSVERAETMGLADSFIDDMTARLKRMIPAPVAILTLNSGASGCQIAWISGMAHLELMYLGDKSVQLEVENIEFHQATLESNGKLAITDCRQYERLERSSLHRQYQIHSYAGVPIITRSGDAIGTLSVMDFNCRHFDDRQLTWIELFAQLIAAEFERQILVRAQLNSWMGTIDRPLTYGGDDLHSLPKTTSQSATIYHLQSSAISHLSEQLRSPLTSILGMAKVLQQEIYGNLNPRQKTYLDIIYSSGHILIDTIDEIAQIGSIDPNGTHPVLAPVDIEMLCQLVLQSLQPFADRQERKLSLEIGIEQRILLLDRDKFRQIIYYPLLYLIHTAPARRTIAIYIGSNDRHLQVKIYSRNDDEQSEYSSNERQSIDNQFLRRIELGISLSQILADIHHGRSIDLGNSSYQILLPLSIPKDRVG
jgi:signal transduction histidine kinase